MTRHILWVLTILLLTWTSPVFAASKEANRLTFLNKTTDYLAVVGKSEEDKKEILNDRRDIRRQVRSKNEDRRKQAQTKKRMKQQEQDMMRKIYAQ